MKTYTLGFIFDATLENVLLIQKQRPAWQAGKLNGVGGKLEENETLTQCIAREVNEEASLETQPQDWVSVGKMGNAEWEVHVFTTQYHGEKDLARSLTDEEVQWHPAQTLPANIIPNLSWLVPLCLDHLLGKEVKYAQIEYHAPQ